MITIHSGMLSSIYRNAYAKSGNKAETLENILGKAKDHNVNGQKKTAGMLSSSDKGRSPVETASDRYAQMVDKIRSSLQSSGKLDSESSLSVNGSTSIGMEKLRAQQEERRQKALEAIRSNKNLSEDMVTISTAAIEASRNAYEKAVEKTNQDDKTQDD